MADANSLCKVLGVPLHNIFSGDDFQDYAHNETLGPDAEDKDHGTP